MRKKNKNGIPELAESIDELDQIYCSLEARLSNSKLSPKEQAIIDIYRTIGGIEGNGLHQFWNWEDADRIIASFRFLNENEIADALDKTRWTISVLEQGTDKQGHYKFTKNRRRRSM